MTNQYGLLSPGPSSSSTPGIALATKVGRSIPNVQKPEESPFRLRELKRWVEGNHPDLKLRSVSTTYNCVGLVFGNRRTWIDDDLIAGILPEDGYEKLPEGVFPEEGDLVLYRNAKKNSYDHIGIVISKELDRDTGVMKPKILSKLGTAPEVIHSVDYVCVFYSDCIVEYWSERKIPA